MTTEPKADLREQVMLLPAYSKVSASMAHQQGLEDCIISKEQVLALIDSYLAEEAEERRRCADQIHHREAFLSNQYSVTENVEVCREIEARMNEIAHFKRWLAELSQNPSEASSGAEK